MFTEQEDIWSLFGSMESGEVAHVSAAHVFREHYVSVQLCMFNTCLAFYNVRSQRRDVMGW
jgi:hypothetical protein